MRFGGTVTTRAAGALLALTLAAGAASASDYDIYVLNEKDGLAAHSIEEQATETASATRGGVWTLDVHEMWDAGAEGFELAMFVNGAPPSTETGTSDHAYSVTLSAGDSVSATLTSHGSSNYDLALLDGAGAWFAQSTSKTGADSVSGTYTGGDVTWKVFVDEWWDPASEGFSIQIRVDGAVSLDTTGAGDNTYTFGVGPGELVEVELGSLSGDPPAAPTGLAAAAVSHERVDLSWDEVTDPTGVSEYRVYRDGILVGLTAETAFTETGLDEGAAYTYEVSAINGASLEGGKTSADVTMPADTTPPEILRAGAPTATQVVVVFSEPLEEASAAAAANYSIDNATAISGAALSADFNSVTLATSTLAEGLTYTVSVTGVRDRSAAGNVIAAGSQVTFVHVPGLVCHLKFDETAGDTAVDSSGSGHDGTLLGFDGPTWVAGFWGGALSFDGTDDYVGLAGYKGVTGTDARTVCAWMKTAGTGPVVSWGQDSTSKKWIFRVQSDNGAAGAIRVEISGGYLVGDTDLRDDAWHHVAAVFEDDGTPDVLDCLLYVDGALQVPSASQSVALDTAAAEDVRVGFDHQNRWFGGLIDDVRIYARALGAEEIETLITGDVTPPAAPAGLTATAVGPDRIDLDWQPGAEPDVASYKVYRDTAEGFTASDANLVAVVVDVSGYSDTALAATTVYYCRVTALDRSGNESAASGEVSAATKSRDRGGGGCLPTAAPNGRNAAAAALLALACIFALKRRRAIRCMGVRRTAPQRHSRHGERGKGSMPCSVSPPPAGKLCASPACGGLRGVRLPS